MKLNKVIRFLVIAFLVATAVFVPRPVAAAPAGQIPGCTDANFVSQGSLIDDVVGGKATTGVKGVNTDLSLIVLTAGSNITLAAAMTAHGWTIDPLSANWKNQLWDAPGGKPWTKTPYQIRLMKVYHRIVSPS